MARILIVAAEFEPFSSSGINRISFFKKYLEKQGHFVAVLSTVTSAQNLPENTTIDKKNQVYRAYSVSMLFRRLLSSRRLPIYPKLALSGKYATWVPFAEKKGTKLIKKLDIDLVLTSFPDFASVQVAEIIARKTSTKLITDFRDPPYWIYDEFSENKKTLLCQKIIKNVMKNSHNVIVCTSDSKNSIAKYYNIDEKIQIIGNGYNADVIAKLAPYTKRNDNFIEVVHIGSFYDEGRDIKPIVFALEQQAKQQNKQVKLRLIGDTPDDKTINKINEIAKSIIVSIEPPVAMFEALSIAQQADVLLLLQGERFNRQIPAKVYEYLALNRPIWAVVGINGATHRLLNNYSKNVVISDYNSQESINDDVNKAFAIKTIPLDVNNLSRQEQISTLNTIIEQ